MSGERRVSRTIALIAGDRRRRRPRRTRFKRVPISVGDIVNPLSVWTTDLSPLRRSLDLLEVIHDRPDEAGNRVLSGHDRRPDSALLRRLGGHLSLIHI